MMPILDVAPLNFEDERVLRGVLGPTVRAPLHAEEMREAARRSQQATNAGGASADLTNAIKASDGIREKLIRRLHSSV